MIRVASQKQTAPKPGWIPSSSIQHPSATTFTNIFRGPMIGTLTTEHEVCAPRLPAPLNPRHVDQPDCDPPRG